MYAGLVVDPKSIECCIEHGLSFLYRSGSGRGIGGGGAERFSAQPPSAGGGPALGGPGRESFWSFCVDYLESGGAGLAAGRKRRAGAGKDRLPRSAQPRGLRGLRPAATECARRSPRPSGAGLHGLHQRAAGADGPGARRPEGGAGEDRRRGRRRIEKYGTEVAGASSSGNGTESAAMRRANHLFEQIVDRDNLRLAVAQGAARQAVEGRRAGVRLATWTTTCDQMRTDAARGDFPLWAITTSSRSSIPRSG